MRLSIAAAVFWVALGGLSQAKSGPSTPFYGSTGSHYVRSHTTKSGTYVPAHQQTDPNGTRRDNWSTKGNVNPYTGKPGTKPLEQ